MSASECHLLVSDPPHAEGWDAAAAGSILGLVAAEMRLRANFDAPEIWGADTDASAAAARAEALRECGLGALVVPIASVATIPPASPVRGFALSERGIEWTLPGGEFLAPADAGVIAVRCKPKESVQFFSGGPSPIGAGARAGIRRGMMMRAGPAGGLIGATVAAIAEEGTSEREQLDAATRIENQGAGFVDLYFYRDGGLKRLELSIAAVDFSGLGDRMRSTARANLDLLVELVGQTHASLCVDDRLVDFQPRSTPLAGVPLPAILEAIYGSKDGDRSLDLASRLVFLTRLAEAR